MLSGPTLTRKLQNIFAIAADLYGMKVIEGGLSEMASGERKKSSRVLLASTLAECTALGRHYLME
jgi:hypothetical protein